jgi:hypothetical protein
LRKAAGEKRDEAHRSSRENNRAFHAGDVQSVTLRVIADGQSKGSASFTTTE